jgi:aspartokinase
MENVEQLLVMKFGGTSVGSAERMKVACDLICASAATRPVVAVVSAMSKITDLLLDTTRHAEAGDVTGMDRNLKELDRRHLEAAEGLGLSVEDKITELVGEFRRIAGGIQLLAHRPPRTVDEAIAIGERLSAMLISEYLRNRGVAA